MAMRHSTPADSSFSIAGKKAWEADHTGDASDINVTQSGTGAVSRSVQAALRAMVRTGDFDTAGHFNTAQAALTEKIGIKEIRLGTGAADGIVFPTTANAPFQFSLLDNTFNGVVDPQMILAYNYGRAVTSEPLLQWIMEGNYNDGADRWMEVNLDYQNLSGGTGKRFLAFQVNRITDASKWALIADTIRLESLINNGEIVITPSTGTIKRQIADGAVTTAPTSVIGVQLTNSTGGAGTVSPSLYFSVSSSGGVKLFSSGNGSTGGIFHVATENTSGTLTDRLTISETGNMALVTASSSLSIGSSSITLSDTGSGNGVIQITAVGTVDSGEFWLRSANGGTVYWKRNNSGHILAGTDNSYDIGASGATRPRNVFVGTSVVTPVISIPSGGSTTISTGVGSVKMSSTNPATNAAWIPVTYAGTVYFVPGYTTNSP